MLGRHREGAQHRSPPLAILGSVGSPAVRPLVALRRGFRRRCPRCGEGPLFAGWNRLREACPVCGLRYERHTGDTWFFMYMSTAGLTGVLVVCMFLLRPGIVWLGQIAVAAAALVVIGLTLPYRKGVAVAIDYLIERSTAGGEERM
jgi:uncharacterized protein (DUF983 family)